VIAATENNTRVVVYPNDDWLYFDTNPGDSIVLVLNAGETFAFRAASTAENRHINGVPVKSDKDIVITYYDDSIRKKNSANTTCSTSLSYDIIGDQLVPVNHTGKEYVIVKGQLTTISAPNCPADGGESIFITSTEPNTDIVIDGALVTTLTLAGQLFSYPVETATRHLLASKPVYVTHITGFGGETGGALVPSLDNSAGSEKITFSRSPNVSDAFQLNLIIRNTSDFYNIRTSDAFTVTSTGVRTSIPDNYFDYTADSTYVYLKKTAEVQSFISSKIPPGVPATLENTVAGFQLGILSGGSATGAKYGYVSDFSPKPVKQVIPTKDSLRITISSRIFAQDWTEDELLILKITDTLTNVTWYDTAAVVTKTYGFHDTIYVDSGTYKCEIVDMGANVEMPEITIDGHHLASYGYPEFEYYLFTLPGRYDTKNTISVSNCDSLVSPGGRYTWINDGVYYDTIPNAEGFDSLLTVNLTIKHSTSAVLNETAIRSYVSPDGTVLVNSGTYYQTIPNSAGCDSNITINLAITIPDTENTIWAAGCDSLVAPSGRYTWFTDGIFYDTIPNAEGADSLLTVNVDIKNSSSAILNETACDSYVSPGGQVWETSGTYYETIPNSEGCDSNITINLTVVKIDKTVATIDGTMKAAVADASYQWLACGSGLDIEGEVGQMYTAVTSGLYAVRITKDGCTVTSNCTAITITANSDINDPGVVYYYPNPVTDELRIDLKEDYARIELTITDLSGRLMLQQQFSGQKNLRIDTGDFNTGLYFVHLQADDKQASFKIVKE
jgi:hypothetical protein